MATFVKLTGFCNAYAPDQEFKPIWVNAERIAYFEPIRKLGQANTRIYFAEDGSVVVAESCDEVLAAFRWCGLELTA